MSRPARFAKYASWTFLDQAVMLGLTRLLLFPLLLWIFVEELDEQAGANLFGSFVLAIGFVNLVGLSPSNGLSGYVLRDAINHRPDEQRLMLRTVFLLSVVIAVPFALVYLVGGGAIGSAYNDSTLATLLPFLGVHLLLLNVTETVVTIYRVRRTFGRLVLVHAIQVAMLFPAVPLYFAFGVVGVGYAYVLAGVAALVAVLFLERRTFLERPFYSARFTAVALRVWLPFSAGSFIFLSAIYLDRLLLGYWWPPAEVATFFAAAGTARMLMIPGNQAYTLLLSLLGRIQTSRRFSRRFYALYIVGSLGVALLIFAVGGLLGRFILSLLYPSLLDKALPLWKWVLAATAVLNIHGSCRPFISKVLPPNYIPVMAGISVVGRLVPVLLLVPRGGSHGAAQAMLIGAGITASVWVMVYVKSFVFSDLEHVSCIAENEREADNPTRAWDPLRGGPESR